MTEPEYDIWEQTLWAAYTHWEDQRCPGCGQNLDESIIDTDIPAANRPKWQAGYQTCGSCEHLEAAQIAQAEIDTRRAERLGRDIPSHHRYWQTIRHPHEEETPQ